MNTKEISNVTSGELTYRPDIDGLRGIAILAVVLYHFFPNRFKGGFAGVDIFFVISGYLITSIIFKNLSNDKFSFLDFYSRRIKRIFPALIIVLSSCLIFGWFSLFASEYKQLGEHARASALFYNNFLLFKQIGYFDIEIVKKPLAHLWSLAVEEQFYIIWPLILWLAYKNKYNYLSICIAIIICSFYQNIHNFNHYRMQTFYLPQYRFWELLSGGLLAYITVYKVQLSTNCQEKISTYLGAIIYNPQNRRPVNIKEVLGFIGLVTVVVLIFTLNHNKFPGRFALWPVIGAFCIIAAGSEAWINKKILSNKLILWFGLISYPLYLWHWPIISFIHIIEGNGDRKILSIGLLVSIFLSYLTYRLIEKPLRSCKTTPILILTLVGLLGIIGFASNRVYQKNGCKNRKANYEGMLSNVNVWNDVEYASISECKKIFGDVSLGTLCHANSLAPKFLVLGDSHGDDFGYGIVKAGLSAIVFTKPACLPFLNYYANNNDPGHIKKVYNCNAIADNGLKAASILSSIEYVILHSRITVYLDDTKSGKPGKEDWKIEANDNAIKLTSEEAFIRGYVELVEEFTKLGKKVILVFDQPHLPYPPNNCIKRLIKFSSKAYESCILERSLVESWGPKDKELFAEIKRRAPEVMIYDPWHNFCDDKICKYTNDIPQILYRDLDHLNPIGLKLVGKDFVKWLTQQENN